MDQKYNEKLVLAFKIGVCILISAALTLAIMWIFAKPQCCQKTSERPKVDMDNLSSIPSKDHHALVSISTYMKFGTENPDAGDQFIYQPLKLKGLELVEHAINTRTLIIILDCANVTLSMETEDQVMAVKSMKVDILDTKEVYAGSCSANKTGLYVKPNNSYFCYSRREYNCDSANFLKAKAKRPLALVIDVLRFEMDGNPSLIEKGIFSKPPEFCF